MFTILSWNILQGGGSRSFQQLEKLASLKPTVCIFSEYRNNESGNTIRAGLLKLGYRFQYVTNAVKDENSVFIASMLPCTNELYPKSDPNFSNNILAVHFDVFSIIGVYLPHKKDHILLDFINQLITASDYNTGINGVDQEGKSFWYEEKVKQLSKNNYTDAFRYKNGDVKEYNWYSHQGNGYRYDHTYVHNMLLPIIKNCKYIHDWRQDGLSDHSPMLLELA
jgi:exodeoxyribonuclease III